MIAKVGTSLLQRKPNAMINSATSNCLAEGNVSPQRTDDGIYFISTETGRELNRNTVNYFGILGWHEGAIQVLKYLRIIYELSSLIIFTISE
jgi:hypothetical protein